MPFLREFIGGTVMELTSERAQMLNVGLNESQVLSVDVNPISNIVKASFRVLCLPLTGPFQSDFRIQILFQGVGRLTASRRIGEEMFSRTAPVSLNEIGNTVQNFQGMPIYGWSFFNAPGRFARSPFSLDWTVDSRYRPHCFGFSFDGDKEKFDLNLSFENIEVCDRLGRSLDVERWGAAALRWWENVGRIYIGGAAA